MASACGAATMALNVRLGGGMLAGTSQADAPQVSSVSWSGLRAVPAAMQPVRVAAAGQRAQQRRGLDVRAQAIKETYVDYKQKRAAPAAIATIAANFPNSMEIEAFIKASAEALTELGFNPTNSIAIVNTCRDEVCRPLVNLVDREFGLSFNISGLGGLINCGKTGLKAAMSHSPEAPCDIDGTLRERYVFMSFPHISIGESGEEGSLLRRGRGKASSACGALIAVQSSVCEALDPNEPYPSDDFEFAALKRKVLAKPICKETKAPSLIAVTKAAQEVIAEDLEDLISKVVDPAVADYAVIVGVQIHSGNQIDGEPFRMDRTVDYIAPATMYAVIRGEKVLLHCEIDQITSIKSIKEAAISGY